MKETTQMTLRRAKQSIRLEGTVRSHHLKMDDDKIYGKIFISTGEHSLHPVDVFETKYEIGAEGKVVRPEFHTLYALMETLYEAHDGTVAVRLGKGSHLDVFAKYNDDGEFQKRQIIKGKSLEVGISNVNPQAAFRAEVWISNILPLSNASDNDKVTVNTWIPVATNTVVPFEFCAYGDVAAYMIHNFGFGDTVTVNGKIVNEIKKAEKSQKGFGTSWTSAVNVPTREYVITGCDFAPHQIEDAFDGGLVALAIDNYSNILLPKLKAKAEMRHNSKGASTQVVGSFAH